jgi:hypothetical protein
VTPAPVTPAPTPAPVVTPAPTPAPTNGTLSIYRPICFPRMCSCARSPPPPHSPLRPSHPCPCPPPPPRSHGVPLPFHLAFSLLLHLSTS